MLMSNSSSSSMTNSTVSSESAPRSFTKEVSRVIWSLLTPNCSPTMSITRSSTEATLTILLVIARLMGGRYVSPGLALSRDCRSKRPNGTLCPISWQPVNDSDFWHPCLYLPRRVPGGLRALHSQSAVDDKDVPGDETGRLAGQEQHGIGHVLGLSEPSQGGPLFDLFEDLLSQSGTHLRGDEAGCHRIDRDVSPGQLPGDRPGQTDHSGLGGRVVGLAGVAHHPRHAGHVDDPPAAPLQHRSGRRPGEQKCPPQIDVDHGVELLVFHAQDDVVAGDSGVVDQDLEAAPLVDDCVDHFADALAVGHVAGERLG